MESAKVATSPGSRFGSLVLLGTAPTRRSQVGGRLKSVGMRFVRCDCGTEYSIPSSNWGRVRSCFKCKYDLVSTFATGDKVGCLTIIARRPRGSVPGRNCGVYECRCECGKTRYMSIGAIKERDHSVCKCGRHQRHGMASKRDGNRKNHMMYREWCSIKDRCYNPRCKAYKYYGARGIKLCSRWLIMENFIADVGFKQPGMSLDRIDPDGDYSPENCRWADKWTQSRNRGFNTVYRFNGQELTLGQWIAKIKIEGELVSLPDIGKAKEITEQEGVNN